MSTQRSNLVRLFFKKVAIYLFLPLLTWAIAYPFLPYWNHFHLVNGESRGTQYESITTSIYGPRQGIKDEAILASLTSSIVYSELILLVREMPCQFSYLKRPNNILNWNYSINKPSSINIMLEAYTLMSEHYPVLTNGINEARASKDLIELISRCALSESLTNPELLVTALFSKSPIIIQTLISTGINVNTPHRNTSGTKSYTALYMAELLLKSEKDETKKQSLIKIIELLKQAGAKSEMVELPAK